jgi:LPS-assembly protein
MKADSMSVDVPTDNYHATGSVYMVQDGVSLLADSVIYSRLTGNAVAEGNIFMQKSDDTLKGDRLSFNVMSQQGNISNAELFVKKSNFKLRGKLVEKTGDEDYHVDHGSFTTCDGDNPSWHIEARDLQVTMDEFATARDAVFYAGSIPLLYSPYLLFPVKRDRQSGLLIPKLGHSTKKGLYIDQPYYWAIDPSQDVTFDLDIESSRGVGVGEDYRYMREHGSEGRMQGFGIYDTKAERFRGEIDQKHLEFLTPATTLASDLHLITDRSYYKDYGEIAGEYNRQLLESSLFVDHRWERYDFTGEVRYAEDLLASNNDATLQRLPQLTFIGAGEKVGPIYVGIDSGFTNFQRSVGELGQRLDLHPRLAYYPKPADSLDLALYGGYRERLYNSYGSDFPTGRQEIGQADAGGVLSMPLERIYNGQVRHLLIPSVDYRFVQHQSEANVPFFDYGDRVPGESRARWSLTNVFTGKFTQGDTTEYRDLVYLKLSQGYQFSGERRELPLLTLVDPGHRLSDLILESRVTPMKPVTIEADARYNTIDGNLSSGNLGVELKGTDKNLINVAYRYSRNEVDYLEGRLAFPVTTQLSATVLGRYSFDKGAFLESRYALEYKRQCWGVIASYSQRPSTALVSGNTEFTLNFTLYGVGALGPVRAF